MIIEHVLQRHQSKPLYAAFVDMHVSECVRPVKAIHKFHLEVRALAEPLRDIDVRKAASTLSAVANEKQKEQREKASGKKKPKAALKPVLGAAKANNKCVVSSVIQFLY